MSTNCPECGAPLPATGSCRERFFTLLDLEWRIPGGPGARAHFLAVASYNLQHPSAFEPAALTGLLTALEEVLAGRSDILGVRRAAGRTFGGSARVLRTRGVLPGAGSNGVVAGWPRVWPLTVLEVCESPPDREHYLERVEAWAVAVVATLRAARAGNPRDGGGQG